MRNVVQFLTCVVLQIACGGGGNGGSILVTSGATDHVFVLDASTGTVTDSIALDPRRGEIDEPHGIAATPSMDHWYVTLSHGEPTLWKFETDGNRLVGRLPLNMAGASRIGLSSGGEIAYVPDYYRDDATVLGEITAVRLHDLSVLARRRICPAPHDAQPSPDGQTVAVTCSTSDQLLFLDSNTLGIKPATDPNLTVGSRPLNVVWAIDSGSVYVSLHGADQLAQISPEGGLLGVVPVGTGPAQLGISSTHNVLVTANRGDGTSSIVNLDDFTEELRIPLGVSHPHGVATSADGHLAFITYEGDAETRGGVVAIDMERRAIAWRREVGTYTLGVTYITHK